MLESFFVIFFLFYTFYLRSLFTLLLFFSSFFLKKYFWHKQAHVRTGASRRLPFSSFRKKKKVVYYHYFDVKFTFNDSTASQVCRYLPYYSFLLYSRHSPLSLRLYISLAILYRDLFYPYLSLYFFSFFLQIHWQDLIFKNVCKLTYEVFFD